MTLEEFEEQGMERMSDEEIEGFLSSQSTGVLGLPTDGPPSMRPLSFWFDGESSLYFLYILGSSSRKDALSIQADIARFLVYRAETMFNWRSVLLAGSINEVPEVDREAVKDKMDFGRRPEVFERASKSANTELYRFQIQEQTGIKHTGLPPGFEE